MVGEAFPRRLVERSFRKFDDAVSDLIGAHFQAWEELLRCLIEFCETDPVMKVVIDSLNHNANVNIDEWYAEFQESVGSMVGTGRYSIPTNDEDKTALYYQFMKALSDGRIASDFAVDAFGETDFQDMVAATNRAFVRPFAREVKYRIQDVETDTQGQQEVSREALVVFQNHYHGPVQLFDNIRNSPIKTGDVMGTESKKTHDQSVNVGNLTNSNLAAHSSHSNQSVSVTGGPGELIEQILTILRSDPSISDDDREDAIGDVESLKIQLNKKKKDAGTIEKIVNSLEKVGPIASLVVKLLELLPSTT